MHRNIAPDTKPCDTICTNAPETPISLNRKKPKVTKPMWAIDE